MGLDRQPPFSAFLQQGHRRNCRYGMTLAFRHAQTPGNIAATRPANGTFTTYLANSNTSRISSNGIATAPEPGSVGLMLVGAVGLCGSVVCIKRRFTMKG